MKTKRWLAISLVAGMLGGALGGCDHLRSKDSGVESTDDAAAQKKEPASMMPGGDRYSGNAAGTPQ